MQKLTIMSIRLIVVVLCFDLVDLMVIQPLGPTHRNYAIKCLEQISKHAYKFSTSKYKIHTQFLLTHVITKNLTSPGYEVQEAILKTLHKQLLWPIEVIQHKRISFNSFSENCKNAVARFGPQMKRIQESPNCKRKHVVHLKTQLYVFIADDLNLFYKKIEHISKTNTFNNEALYIIYYTKITLDDDNIAQKIILYLYKYSIRNTVLLVSRNITKFGLYSLNIAGKYGISCYENVTVTRAFECNQGYIETNGNPIFERNDSKSYFQCYKYVQALPYEPFVNSPTTGIESDVIHELGKALNVSFRIVLYPNATIQLGEKLENGSWTGFLKPIFDDYQLGIGNVPPEIDFFKDFTYSVGYSSVKVVFVVPIANLIPSWRVLLVIFKIEIWAICLAVIFGFAMAFYAFKMHWEVNTFKTFEKCIEAAYQILIAHPLPIQPITNFTRVYFISLALFAIIINSVYTSSLIFYLQNPISEHQISSGSEIAEYGLSMGGSAKYIEMFNSSIAANAKKLLASYQTVSDELDTYNYWLQRVANERNICTIAIKLHVNYLISKGNPTVTDRHGNAKVFILPQPLRTQPIGIIMRKGNFFERELDKVIQRLIVEAGLIDKIKGNYVRASLEKSDDQENDNDGDDDNDNDSTVLPLSPYHLEGAFAILALGQVSGILVFIIEIAYYHISKAYRKKRT